MNNARSRGCAVRPNEVASNAKKLGLTFALLTALCPAAATAACDLVCLAKDPLVDASHGPKAPKGRPSQTGAIGDNRAWEEGKRPAFSVDEQKEAATYVEAGLVRQRPDWEQQGWLGVQWALSRQNEDGSFQGKYPVHSATMFLEAATRAWLLDKRFAHSPPPDVTARLLKGVRALAQLDPRTNRELVDNANYTHRIWMMAALMENAAKISDDPSFISLANDYAFRAISKQRPDGVMPERNGFDVGYHAASMVYAARFIAESNDPKAVQAAKRSLDLGAKWLATRVRSDGSIDPEGSSRTGVERLSNGRTKGIFYGVITEAFASAGLELDNQAYRDIAKKIEASADFQQWAGN